MASKKKLKRKIKALEWQVRHERRERDYWLHQWQIAAGYYPTKAVVKEEIPVTDSHGNLKGMISLEGETE
jgi:hypothetical protein